MKFRAIIASLLVATTPTGAMAQEEFLFDIHGLSIERSTRGGCSINFELENDSEWTLKVHGDVFLTDGNDVTLGEASLFFPPAIPSGKARAQATFYHFNLAGGSCPKYFKFTVTTDHCEIVGQNKALKDRYCRMTKSFSFDAPS